MIKIEEMYFYVLHSEGLFEMHVVQNIGIFSNHPSYFCKQAAEQMVKFQLRHGNDLLAMDSLRDCDVRNVKEFKSHSKISFYNTTISNFHYNE